MSKIAVVITNGDPEDREATAVILKEEWGYFSFFGGVINGKKLYRL